MNNFKIEIYEPKDKVWVDYSKYAVFPPKFANLLDEQLDEAFVSLKQVPKEYFRQLLKARITFINTPEALFSEASFLEKKNNAETQAVITYDATTKRITETKTVNYVIASDNAIEYKYGDKIVYDHEIYLIELTKILEGFICDSITFTNSIAKNNQSAFPAQHEEEGVGAVTIEKPFVFSPITPNVETSFPLLGIIKNDDTGGSIYINNYLGWDGLINPSFIADAKVTLYRARRNGDRVQLASLSGTYDEANNTFSNSITELKYTFSQYGNYQIEYIITNRNTSNTLTLTFFVEVSAGAMSSKKWTITDVINRCCDLVIPLRSKSYSELMVKKPRFRLQGVEYLSNGDIDTNYQKGSIAERLDKIISPEFAFTKMTFREQLKQVGGRIHGEPRITSLNYDEDGTPWFEIGFDFYGSNEQSNIKNRHRVSAGFKTDINDYCTSLDSSVDNLVNQLDWAQGVVVEPFQNSGDGGGISLRCETTTARLAEDNSTFIPTARPIYRVGNKENVYITYIPRKGIGRWDITRFIVEEDDYKNLSSYDSHVKSKALALYYTQGQKNIKGLFFKNPNAVNPIFSRYAIINILRMVTGEEIELSGTEYMELRFEISYGLLYSARVKTSKQTVIGGLPRTLAYNQGANLIENTYYGENLKGVVERLGNVEKTYTYHLAFLSDVPKAGMLFDDNYYISAVSVEFLPTYIKCTVGLSKDFNRLSSYVGISSNMRMWEVSEKQAFERETLFSDYVFITQNESVEGEETLYARNIAETLFNKYPKPQITNAVVDRLFKDGSYIGTEEITLPAISSAIGNSLLFSFSCEDNYSAGQQIKKLTWREGDKLISGYWGDYVRFSDVVGGAYWILFNFFRSNQYSTTLPTRATAETLPAGRLENPINMRLFNTPYCAYKYRKDSREIPSIIYGLNIVTDDESIIIGSGLAKNCSLVNAKPQEYMLCVFNEKLNKFSDNIDLSEAIEGSFIVISSKLTITLPAGDWKAWGIFTKPNIITEQVLDENGDIVPQSIQVGGELVIGQNKIPENKTFYFRMKEKIYEI